MSKAKSTTSGSTYTIVTPMRTNGAMRVRESATGETYEVVDYVDELLRERIAALAEGSTVRLELTPIADCTNVCRATQLRPGGLPEPGL